MSRLVLYVVLVVMFCALGNCKKDCYDPRNPDCADYDPCIDEIKATADFGFYKKRVGDDSTYWLPIRDTFYNLNFGGGSKLYFRAHSSEMDNYSWTVGSDPRMFTDSIFFLFFENINGPINANLKTEKQFLEMCFPVNDQEMSLSKTIQMKAIDDPMNFPIIGKFEGYDEDAISDVYTVEIETYSSYIRNFPKGCQTSSIPILRTGRSFVFDTTAPYQCGHPEGGGVLQTGNQELIIDYTIDVDGIRVAKRFRGTRLE